MPIFFSTIARVVEHLPRFKYCTDVLEVVSCSMKTYRKTATVKAKLFTQGDEDGLTWTDRQLSQARDDQRFGISPPKASVPYVLQSNGDKCKGAFGEYQLLQDDNGKWLVPIDEFNSNYTEM